MASEFEKFRRLPLHDSLDYTHMLRKLLPKGKIWGFFIPGEDDVIYDAAGDYEIWNDDPLSINIINDSNASSGTVESSWFGKFMIVIGTELARLETRVYDMINESIPGISTEMIEDYRYQYVREDIEGGLITSDEDIQRLAHSKEYELGVPFTAENAEAFGLSLGFVINVIEGSSAATPAICGVARCGLERCATRGVYSTITIEVISGTANYEVMQLIFENTKPAHVVLVWDDQR